MTIWTLPIIDNTLCTRCGACVSHCPTQAVDMQASGPVISRPDDCNYCTTCERICPEHAVRCEFEIVWEPASQQKGVQ